MQKNHWFSFLAKNVLKKHRTMKLSFLLFALALFNLHANSYAQNKKLSLNVKNEPIESVLKKVEAQSKFNFFYKTGEVDVNRKVSIDVVNVSIKEILKILFENQNVVYKLIKKQIVLKSIAPPDTVSVIGNKVEANTKITIQSSVSGTVTDSSGSPLPGANILEKGTTNGVVADFDGNFSITVADENSILVISYLGYSTKEIPVNDQTNIAISLEEDAAGLDEVVVVGYGTARRKDISGSVSSINIENSPIANIPSSNPLQSLQGRIAGLNLAPQNSPGTSPSIVIRGQNSINGSNEPLIVLDGIIFLGNIGDISPGDIASFDILKDASAAAAYGSRAANGVIVITTKKGKTGKPTIKLSSTTAFNVWHNKFDMMNINQWEVKYAAQNNYGVADIVFDDVTPTQGYAQRVNTDWMDLISRTGIVQDQRISVSGSTEKTNYYFSGGYNKEKGVLIGDDFKRISLRMRLNTDITDWLTVGVDGTYNNNDYSGIASDVSRAFQSAPISYPYRFDGMPFNYASNTSTLLERYPSGQSVPNPLWGTDGTVDDIDKSDFFRFAGYATLKIPKIRGLSYRMNYSINSLYEIKDRFFYENYYVSEASDGNYFERYSPEALQTKLAQANGYTNRRKRYSYVMDHILNYNRTFGDHYLNATLVATRDYTYNKNINLTGSDFSVNGNTTLGIDGLHKANVITTNIEVKEQANIGYLGRLMYTYKNKYHLNALIRRDGASVFGADKKWGNFPTVGLAWTVSEEEFLSQSNFIDYLKFKASYGQNGNQGIEPYESLARAASGSDGGIRYEFGDNPTTPLFGVQLLSLASPNLGWETTTSFNIGLETRFLNNRVSLAIDYYTSETTDQIFLRNIPIQTGFQTILSSLGRVDNKGIEVNLSTTNISTNDFTWSSNLTYWKNRNVLARLYGDDLDGDGKEDDDIGNSLFIGESLGAIYGYEYDGVVQESDTDYIANTGAFPGDPKFSDLDGDGFIDADNDRKILGFRKENFRMGLANTFTYKDFSLYVFASGVFGGGKDNFYLGKNLLRNSLFDRADTNDTNKPFWTPENQSQEYLRPNANLTRYLGLQSRGFIRIQDISLSYSLPKDMLNKMGISSVQVYGSVRNLYTFTDWYGGGDPEVERVDGDNEDNSIYGIQPRDNIAPVPTTYSLGLNISL